MEVLTWKARIEKNLTLRELEAITGISKSTLNTIENGLTLRQLKRSRKRWTRRSVRCMNQVINKYITYGYPHV